MKRLLIIITRMYAVKGAGNDEFTRFWATAEQSERDYLLFENSTDGEQRYVVVAHGHDYPDRLDQQAINSARRLALEGFNAVKQPEDAPALLTGLVFHPHPAWMPPDIEPLRRELRDCLEAAGAQVLFVKEFSGGGAIERVLAPKCRSTGTDFATEFERIWSLFDQQKEGNESRPALLPVKSGRALDLSDYARQVGGLKHSFTQLLQPINIDLQSWEQDDFSTDYGLDIIAFYGDNKAQAFLAQARQLIEGDAADDRQGVRGIISQVKPLLAGTGRAQAMQKIWSNIESAFRSEGFAKTTKLLALLGAASNSPAAMLGQSAAPPKKSSTEILSELRHLLKAGNDFQPWYHKLETELNELRNLLS